MGRAIRASLILALFVAIRPELCAQSSISWSPNRLFVQLLRGTMNVAVVSFTASEDLGDIDVSVVPELQGYVTPAPSHYPVVSRNSPVMVHLTLSIGESIHAGLYEGTITIRSGRRVIAKPLPVSLLVVDPSSVDIPSGVSLPSTDRFATDFETGLNFAKDEIIIFVDPSAATEQIVSLAAQFGAGFLGHEEGLGFYQLQVPIQNLADASRLISQLESEPVVRFAVPHFFGFVDQAGRIPDDPSWESESTSWAQKLIHLPEAWELKTGSTGTKIGFVDGGFDLNHEDLIINGGLSDFRFNFGDFRQHGTEVASIAAAVGNNRRGLAGAMWESNLLAFSCSAGRLVDGVEVIDFPACQSRSRLAIDRGARIINASVSVNLSQICYPSVDPTTINDWLEREKSGWRQVINYANSVPGGVLFVFGAGNDRTLFDSTVPASLSLPGEFPASVISVGAVDRHNNQASYSNYGQVSVWAPGGDAPVRMCPDQQRPSPFPDSEFPPYLLGRTRVWTARPETTYGYADPGTSLAAPFVTGIAGLMLSVNPNLTAAQLKTIIHDTADGSGNFDPDGNPVRIVNAFRAVQQAVAPPPSQVSFSRTDLPAPPFPSALATGDFNLDSAVDLAVLGQTPGTVSILLGNGDGTFRPRTDHPSFVVSISDVTTGDFNRDGKLDLAAATFGSAVASVLLGNGDGTFGSRADFPTGTRPVSIARGDFNADGRVDLATANCGSGTVSILVGNGDGTFGTHTDFLTTDTCAGSVAIADFNRDGKLDVAVANPDSNAVSILLGSGTGALGAAVVFAAGQTPLDVTVADFNMDTKPDLAVPNFVFNPGTVSVFLGNGDGTLGARTALLTGAQASSAAAGDFNRDGKLDLAARFNLGVSVLLGNGDGTFGPKTDFATGIGPGSIATGDFNADGKLDIAVTNANSNTVSILSNTTQ